MSWPNPRRPDRKATIYLPFSKDHVQQIPKALTSLKRTTERTGLSMLATTEGTNRSQQPNPIHQIIGAAATTPTTQLQQLQLLNAFGSAFLRQVASFVGATTKHCIMPQQFRK
jgi:hypothetical protein